MRIVLDTNVLLAAFGTRGLCEAVLAVCLESHELVLSEHILAEVRRHLQGKFRAPERQVRQIVTFLRGQAEVVEPVRLPSNVCRDPSDGPVIGTAIAGGVALLVTGDEDLLCLGQYEGISILSPRAFYDRLQQEES